MKTLILHIVFATLLLSSTDIFVYSNQYEGYWLKNEAELISLANNNDIKAQITLGNKYHWKDGEKSLLYYKKAVKIYKPLAENDNLDAQLSLGWLYEYDLKDPKKALKWHRLAKSNAININSPKSHFILAKIYTSGASSLRDKQKALKMYISSATQGYAKAQTELFDIYKYNSDDILGKTDIKTGLAWLIKAAEQNYPDAEEKLSIALGQDSDTDNYAIYQYWLPLLSNKGYFSAQQGLASFYDRGWNGFPKDKNKAFYWRKKLVIEHKTGYGNLATYYDKGIGVAKNKERAFELILEGAKNSKTPWNMINVAERYRQGNGTNASISKSDYWYSKALELYKNYFDKSVSTSFGISARDYYILGEIYYHGWGIEKNIKEANKYYKMFLDNNFLFDNYYELGNMYYNGKGVEKDKIKAYQNLRRAAVNSNLKAQNLLDKLCSESPWACK